MKKIVFITGTRADFAKIKSLMLKVEQSQDFELFVFVTGMHLSQKFGSTATEVEKYGFTNIFKYINFDKYFQMDKALASTIDGFSKYICEIGPDLIVVHGDRIEPLAAAIVGSLNNILVAHIEGGELSGTIDDSLRHAISKLSHIHLVNDKIAKNRLIQLGEDKKSIFIIGSPDLEILSNNSVSLEAAKEYYEISFKNYAIAMFHPVTTEFSSMDSQARDFTQALLDSGKNFIVILPNNDLGFEFILQNYTKLKDNDKFKIFPSLRFECFIALLENADFIIGNSSCILKEAIFLGIKGINVGTRQQGRNGINQVCNIPCEYKSILESIQAISPHIKQKNKIKKRTKNSSEYFIKLLESGVLLEIPKQKKFQDL
ncbi:MULTISPECIES: UDP-N-acetylglucosamine 2-epimerase [Helicobacter]|uniref:UDP-N-acetylglucosamine 2-epimerase n=1 Tax=Helicobacter TaxID=209 RepID=UPI002FE02508